MILGIVGIIIYRQIRRLLLPLYELKCAATRIAQEIITTVSFFRKRMKSEN